jgi:hypothetical protein
MGVRGTGAYPQGAKYTFPRSYVYRFAISDTGITVVQVANTFTLTAPTLPAYTFTVRIPGNFYVWNSNQYTLDYVILESYYVVSPSPDKIPLDFALIMVFPNGAHANYLQYCPSGILATPIFGSLVSQPDNYWLPKPLHL